MKHRCLILRVKLFDKIGNANVVCIQSRKHILVSLDDICIFKRSHKKKNKDNIVFHNKTDAETSLADNFIKIE